MKRKITMKRKTTMKRKISPLAIVATVALVAFSASAASHVLWYDKPAEDSHRGWEEQSLPIGNGYFGANVFGGVTNEHLVLAHGTVYARKPNRNQPMTHGEPTFTKALDVYVQFPHAAEATNYRRALDIEDAVSDVAYAVDGVKFSREYFTSYPDKVMAMRFTASGKGKLAFALKPSIPFLQEFGIMDGKRNFMGRRGTVVADKEGIDVRVEMEGFNLKYAARFEVVTDGKTALQGDSFAVSDATEATVFMALESNYTLSSDRIDSQYQGQKGCDPNAPDPMIAAKALAAAAKTKGWAALRRAHVADYRSLFNRVTLDLGADAADAEVPTDQLLLAYRNGRASTYLETVYAQYGRYLLIASSRPNGMPANLQGIWTDYEDSPWTGGYWHNINIQMNYWPCFAGNLLECFEPYAAWHAAMRPIVREGTIWYVARCAEQFPGIKKRLPKDPYKTLAPDTWSVSVGEWPYLVQAGGGAASGLTSKLFMEWWHFSQDERVLREHAWPAMHGAAQALVYNVIWTNNAWLCVRSFSHEQQVRDPKTGKLDYYITTGCAFDQQMIHENNSDCLKLAKLLGTNDAVTAEIERQLGHYEPVIVGGSGQIKEFREEDKYGEIGEYHHRHISQLMALMPGTIVTRDTPEWMEAAKTTLNFRGDESTGWALAHRLNAWARLGDGERCHKLIRNLIGKRTYDNLWDAHPPFQIDGNFGGTSGILEMLLQSQAGYIDLLPSLPACWAKRGSFRGVLARGAFEVDCDWADGRPVKVVVRSLKGLKPDVRFAGKPCAFDLAAAGR